MTRIYRETKRAVVVASLLVVLAGAGPAAAQTVEYYHLDALGSVRAITDQTGAVLERHDYLPFGEEWNPPPSAAPRKFTGKERDAETGFDYFGARYLSATTGRFTTTDPAYTLGENLIDPQRWNRYAYVRNNPLRFIDPDGRDTWDLAIGFAQGIGHAALGVVTGPIALATNPAAVGRALAQDIRLLGYGLGHPGDVLDAYVSLATSANDADQRALGAAIGQGTAFAAIVLSPTAKVVPKGGPAADVAASTPVGRLGSPLNVAPGTNAPTTVGGRVYTGHALDRMQGRGLTPSVVEDTVARGTQTPGRQGASVYTTEQARVVVNPNGSVKTVMPK